MSTKSLKKLSCPASTKDVSPPHPLAQCAFAIDLVKVEALEAQGQLLSHLRGTHFFYWKRHAKKLVTRYSKQCAMRNK